jgi:hypothetical protein
VAGDVAAHDGQYRQAVGARLRERRTHQLGGEALALEPRVDERVDEDDQALAAAGLAVARDVPLDADLEARALRHVNDANVRGRSVGHSRILAPREHSRHSRRLEVRVSVIPPPRGVPQARREVTTQLACWLR